MKSAYFYITLVIIGMLTGILIFQYLSKLQQTKSKNRLSSFITPAAPSMFKTFKLYLFKYIAFALISASITLGSLTGVYVFLFFFTPQRPQVTFKAGTSQAIQLFAKRPSK